MNSKLIIGFSLEPETIKLLDANTGTNLHEPGLGNGFLEVIPKVQVTREKNGKIGLHQNSKPLCCK